VHKTSILVFQKVPENSGFFLRDKEPPLTPAFVFSQTNTVCKFMHNFTPTPIRDETLARPRMFISTRDEIDAFFTRWNKLHYY
jgi:hypothetical protein